MRTADFDFELPEDLIAQTPARARDESRLLVFHRSSGSVEHRRFPDLCDYIRAGDVLVLNDSRVIPARLRGVNQATGGAFEMLLLEEVAQNDWWAMMRPGKRARTGTRICVHDRQGKISGVNVVVIDSNEEGHRRLRFSSLTNILDELDRLGEVPLPPYIRRAGEKSMAADRERYQTVYARQAGSIAAPTAGLHLTKPLIEQVHDIGASVCFVTLHVGLGTFAPVKAETLAAHQMHEERYEVPETTAQRIAQAKSTGGRIIAVGTTALRVLESVAARHGGHLVAGSGRTRIFIHPPYRFKVVDALVTNFHLPRSTLLMLVSAFAKPGSVEGRDAMLAVYREAIDQRYRFFSYGDAMLIL
jgi:S-adenosylmethionine:tRNA ribosyltransferase-isomerase